MKCSWNWLYYLTNSLCVHFLYCHFCSPSCLSLILFRVQLKLYKWVYWSTPWTGSLRRYHYSFSSSKELSFQQSTSVCSLTAVRKRKEAENFWNCLCHCCLYPMQLYLYTAHEILIIAGELQKPLLESKQKKNKISQHGVYWSLSKRYFLTHWN